jgi:PIN domain nuclease of toxin-antitoxin system
MTLLLDTNALLWWLAGEPLQPAALERIADPEALVMVSAASVWEVEIKRRLGKLDAPDLAGVVEEEGFAALAISLPHAARAGSLPLHHHDPFDRMLVAQAQLEGLTIVTRDRAFDAYDVPVLVC